MSNLYESQEKEVSRRGFLRSAGTTAFVTGTAASLVSRSLAAGASAAKHQEPLDPAKKIRMGIVGGGFGASFQWHLDPNCIVHAVSDLRPDRRDRLMQVYSCSRSYESLEKLLLDKEIDAVAVFTGVPDHVRHSVAVMDSGKHVICAVPACMSLQEARQLKETKERTGLKYMMAETSYYRYHTIAARDLFGEGKFGEIFHSQVEYHHPMSEKERNYYWYYQGQKTWRYGYAPMMYPTHSTGFLVGVTRERLTEVSCLGWVSPELSHFYGKGKNPYDNPYNCQVGLFKTDQGHMCRNGQFHEGTAHDERAEWYGSKLTYYMPGSGGRPFRVEGPDAPNWKAAPIPTFWERLPAPMRVKTGHGGSHTFLTHEFIAALVEDREPAVDVYESLAMTVPGIVAQESSIKGGEQLKIPSFDRNV